MVWYLNLEMYTVYVHVFLYLKGLGGGSQLCDCVVVRKHVGQLTLHVQRRQRRHRPLQLPDLLLMGLQHEEEEEI